MDLFDLDADARQKLAEICAHEGIDESYASFVARHLDAEDASWRWCCGSNCDPCVTTLGRAVDRARHALRLGPGGVSGGTPSA
ncbi:MAG: hypothetical protein ACE37K_01965 [Planctomycetota bacterium]|jgi:hypothetical protein